MAHLGHGGNVRLAPQIVGAGEVHRRRGLGKAVQPPGQRRRGQGAAAQAAGLRPQPPHLDIQQAAGIDKGFVDIPGGHHHRGNPRPPAGQCQHGPDTLAGALRAVQSLPRPEKPGGVGLTFRQNPFRRVQVIRPGHLSDVQGFAAQERFALMSRHVEPAGNRILPEKIHHRGIHSPASSSSCMAAWSIMAHSIRLRNNSHPVSYTPRMEPVAW